MTWVLVLLPAWFAVAAVLGVVIGRGVHTADVIEHTDETSGRDARGWPPPVSPRQGSRRGRHPMGSSSAPGGHPSGS